MRYVSFPTETKSFVNHFDFCMIKDESINIIIVPDNAPIVSGTIGRMLFQAMSNRQLYETNPVKKKQIIANHQRDISIYSRYLLKRLPKMRRNEAYGTELNVHGKLIE